MNKEEMERERQRRRARIRKRRNRARLRGVILLVVLVAVVSFAFQKLKGAGELEEAYAYGDQAEWFVLKNLDALDESKAYTPEEVGNLRNNIIHDNIEIRIAKGQNHVTRAADYAYDAGDIADIIGGEAEYTGEKKIAFLTFDDGPNHKITPQILDTLKEKDAHATFFVVGKSVGEKTRDILVRELVEGNAIAMHSFSHDYKKLYPSRNANASQIELEAKQSQVALQKVLGEDFYSGVWRYPGGHMSWHNLDAADAVLNAMDVHWIDWNALTGDAEPASRRPVTESGLVEFLNASIKANKDESIVVVLMHDAESKQLTANALGNVIDNLKAQGYEFGILK
ncbi:MAG: polysaccharide deacetylase family protein [Peptoniphilus sp.]|nr:polysaccharide deacetylase family protein [Peptoniphilus sp.]MDD7363011.1 polysaccharide deacetylase [Bacillota bacterium]MDY6045276.1 polysaccharide deacetylase family protein [Peptoniphilus sp.]